MSFRKITLFVLAILFLFVYFPPPNSSHQTPLSPPTVFQEQPKPDGTPSVRNSSSGADIKLFTVAFVIGERVLLDKIPQKRVERAVRFQFSDNPDFLRGVKLKHIRCKDGVVKIPYKRNGRFYIVRVSQKDSPAASSPNNTSSGRFTISASEYLKN